MNGEYCVFCGTEIPEGRQVCYECERKFMNGGDEDDCGEEHNMEQ